MTDYELNAHQEIAAAIREQQIRRMRMLTILAGSTMAVLTVIAFAV